MTESKDKLDFDFEEEEDKSVYLYGRDVTKIPCFKDSFFYGISTGIAVGFLAFMKTSRPQLATHIGFGTFFATTVGYWFPCRYNWSKRKFDFAKIQAIMKKQAIYEGTELEREIKAKGLDV
uniref:Cytochrome c oxidase assembly protein COX20, mitochondrial n=1 Tax=Corethrella appendiculata TaxID=1370023 RepID=U5ESX7_9DIPT